MIWAFCTGSESKERRHFDVGFYLLMVQCSQAAIRHALGRHFRHGHRLPGKCQDTTFRITTVRVYVLAFGML